MAWAELGNITAVIILAIPEFWQKSNYIRINLIGAHLNPAVSLSLVIVKKFPLCSLCHYLAAQYLGSFLGSGLVLLTYRDALHHYTGGVYDNSTAGIFTTFPADGVTNLGGGMDQVLPVVGYIM